jgi:hypothetical protein
MAFLNSRDSSPLPVPAAPAEPADDAAAKPGSGADDGAQKAEKEPVLNEQQAVKGGDKNIGGEGAPKVTGTADKEQN